MLRAELRYFSSSGYLTTFDSMSNFKLNIRDLSSDIRDTAMIAAVVEAFFYGCYCLIFGQYLQVYRKKKKNDRSVLIYPLTLLFLLSTLYFILNLEQTFWLVLRPGTHENFIWVVDIISVAIYGFVDIISQSILIYRCWILWNHRPLLFVPLIMAVTVLGITLVLVVELCRQNLSTSLAPFPPWAIPLAISAICISLASNTIVTGLLVLRITMIYRQCRRNMTHAARSLFNPQVSPIISILIETGMMTFVSQLILVIAFGLQDAYALVVGSPMIMIYGITPTIIVVRVTMGNSYNSQDRTSRTQSIMAFASDSNLQSEIVQTEM